MKSPTSIPSIEERLGFLRILSRAHTEELACAWNEVPDLPLAELVRRPETGLIMARGRIGGGGAPFNLGEVTVTRCTVRLSTGEVGFGHVLGREPKRSELVARFDALWQNQGHRDFVESRLLKPVQERVCREDAEKRRRTAATRVAFFTMVRGEDA